MPRLVAHPARLSGSIAFAVSVLLAMAGTPAHAATTFIKDLYLREAYERQVDDRTCTAASIAMIANFIARRDLGLDQLAILRYEQQHDALDDDVQRGSDPLGWSRGATAVTARVGVATTYAWV